MYLYFFDLDDTICDTKSLVNQIIAQHNINEEDFPSQMDFYHKIEEYLYEKGFEHNKLLDNSTVALLKRLIINEPQNVYYITARQGKVRDVSIAWLKKYDLYLGDEKLLMDTKDIKGKVINDIMQKSKQEFAFLFDDLIDNHMEASKYKNIISCYPH
jgi:hypothetical protein